ncbi:MAG: Hsp20/alpha crystallin family protein [Nanoarchaeota archaeon]|nr:Hsp20/alpha crystallin family protein [Nanoarchaeota archaeon]
MDDEIKNEMDVFAELVKAGATPTQIDVDTSDEEATMTFDNDDDKKEEGQLTIDVFQDEDNLYVQSAVAGVAPDDLDINITKEGITIRGKREKLNKIQEQDYFYEECFWGSFSRSVILPEEVDPEKSAASIKNGILTVKMPKLGRKKGRNLKVKAD